jgi:hypothetical protein
MKRFLASLRPARPSGVADWISLLAVVTMLVLTLIGVVVDGPPALLALPFVVLLWREVCAYTREGGHVPERSMLSRIARPDQEGPS